MRPEMPTGVMIFGLEDWLVKLKRERDHLMLRKSLVERQIKLTRDRIRHASVHYYGSPVSPEPSPGPGAQKILRAGCER